MTPLAPLYLLAALAVAGPILFHLWRRTPRGRRDFSTLMFLTPSPPRVTSRSRIEHWLLLLLRSLALVLLALAFARPLWRTAISTPERANDEELVAVLVDTSASLRQSGVWPELQKRLETQLAALPQSTTVAAYRFDSEWSPVASFSELKALASGPRRELVQSRLRELTPGWLATNLGEALVRTAGALQEAQTDRSTPVRLRILLASDVSQGANLDALHGFEWPSDLKLEVLTIRPQSPTNAGLQWVQRNPDRADDVLRVRISNASDSRREQFQLGWKGTAGEKLPVYVPPGQSRVVVPPERPRGSTATALELSGDDQDFDNTLYLAPQRDETRLVLYVGKEQPDDIQGLRFFLEGVFRAAQRYRVETVGWDEPTTIGAAAKPDFVVIAEPNPAADSVLTTHLEAGGTVLVVANNAEGMQAAAKQCGLEGLTVSESSNTDAMIGDIDFEHPLFAPFAESQFSDFTGIRFWKHRALEGFTPDLPRSETPGNGHVLARFDDRNPALVEFRRGRGRVWVLTSGWHPPDSQLSRSTKFPPLLLRMLEVAAGESAATATVTVGSPIPWPESTLNVNHGRARHPDGTTDENVSVDEPYAKTATPGLYELTRGSATETIAVNLAPEECRTSPLPRDQLESFGVRFGDVETNESLRRAELRQRQLQIEELERTQKLWRWGLIIAVLVLILETWLAGRRRPVMAEMPDAAP